MGIEVTPKLDLADAGVQGRGRQGNVDGVAFLLKKNKIDTLPRHGTHRSAPARSRSRSINGDKQRLEAKRIVIATGSDVARLPGIDIDEKTIVSSTGALALAEGAASACSWSAPA